MSGMGDHIVGLQLNTTNETSLLQSDIEKAADAIEAMEIEILWLRETVQITYAENIDMRSLLETNQWQPIETAPKDGKVLCLVNGDEVLLLERYLINGLYQWQAHHSSWPDEYQPTHWVPLPEAPNE